MATRPCHEAGEEEGHFCWVALKLAAGARNLPRGSAATSRRNSGPGRSGMLIRCIQQSPLCTRTVQGLGHKYALEVVTSSWSSFSQSGGRDRQTDRQKATGHCFGCHDGGKHMAWQEPRDGSSSWVGGNPRVCSKVKGGRSCPVALADKHAPRR